MEAQKYIQLFYKLKLEDIKKAFYFPTKQLLWKYYIPAISLIGFFIIILTEKTLYAITYYSIFVLALFTIKFLKIEWKSKRFFKTSSLCKGEINTVITSDFIKISTKDSEISYTWDNIYKYVKTKDFHLLILKTGKMHILPTRYFSITLNNQLEIFFKLILQ